MDPQRLILHGIRVALVLIVAFVAANAFWFFAAGPEPLPVAVENTDPAKRAGVDIQALQGMNLFGTPAAAPQETTAEVIQETRLSLVLVGVFVADEAEASSALIARSGAKPELYNIGDKLPGGATLIEVFPDRAVIRRSGARELVRFAEPRSISVSRVARAGSAGTATTSRNARVPDEPQQSFAETIEEHRTEIDENPEGALERLGVEPVVAGQAQGYKLGSQPALLARTGLKTGDVILSVNGRPIGNVNQDRLELDNIVAQGTARLEVKRGVRRFFVTVSL